MSDVINGFIEVVVVQFNTETLYQLNIKNIDCFKNGRVFLSGGCILTVKETYEQIKQKIKEAME